MRIFLSYASEDHDLADQIHLALLGKDRTVFFDKNSLPPGGEYHQRISGAVKQSDVFVFLISRHSVAAGSYALTELKHARMKWPHPKGRVLPVRLDDVPFEAIPSYLKAVTVLQPEGNISAEIAAAVGELQREAASSRRRIGALTVTALGMVGAIAAAVIASPDSWEWKSLLGWMTNDEPPPLPKPQPGPTTKPSPKPESARVPIDKRPFAITNILESGTPRSYTAVYRFADDLFYGSFAASLNQGSLHTLLRTYSETQGARFAGEIRPYLLRVEKKAPELLKDDRFEVLLVRIAGQDPIMLKVQDQVLDDRYFAPARRECADIGIKSALGYALIADTFFHMGRGNYERIKLATIRAMDGTPVTRVNERDWLRRFAEERLALLARNARLKQFMPGFEKRIRTYTKLMDQGNWDLDRPVEVGSFLLIDP